MPLIRPHPPRRQHLKSTNPTSRYGIGVLLNACKVHFEGSDLTEPSTSPKRGPTSILPHPYSRPASPSFSIIFPTHQPHLSEQCDVGCMIVPWSWQVPSLALLGRPAGIQKPGAAPPILCAVVPSARDEGRRCLRGAKHRLNEPLRVFFVRGGNWSVFLVPRSIRALGRDCLEEGHSSRVADRHRNFRGQAYLSPWCDLA